MYVLNVHNGDKSNNIYPINIDDYPAIKKHLDKYWDKISIRADKGDTPYNLRNCIYTDLFYEQKIVYPCIMSRGPAFALDNNGSYFVVAPGNIIVGEKLQYLIDCLNSKIFYFALRKFYMGGGIEGELKTNRLLMLPIPNIGTDSTSEDDLIRILGLTNNEVEHINNEYSQLLK